MRFLANENIPKPSVTYLRNQGYEVIHVLESSPGAKDIDIVNRAVTDKQIILTFDKDYGEIIFRHHFSPNPPSVIYFRFKGSDPLFVGHILSEILKSKSYILQGAFTVIGKDSVRQRFIGNQ